MNILTTLAHYGHEHTEASYDTATYATTGVAFVLIFMFFMLVVFVLAYILHAYFMGRIFKKAGVASWIAWIPFYNSWKLLELGGQQGYWVLAAFIPFVNIVSAVFMYVAMYNIGLKLKKEGAFVVLAIFLPTIWLIWLGIDKSTWDESKGAPSLAGNTPPTTHHTHAA